MKTLVLLLIMSVASIAAEAPKIPDVKKLEIRNAQVELLTIQSQMQGLEQQWNSLNSQKQAVQAKLAEAVKSAYFSIGVKDSEYTLDKDLNLIPTPKPPDKTAEVKK